MILKWSSEFPVRQAKNASYPHIIMIPVWIHKECWVYVNFCEEGRSKPQIQALSGLINRYIYKKIAANQSFSLIHTQYKKSEVSMSFMSK